jgi:hypothetical protein
VAGPVELATRLGASGQAHDTMARVWFTRANQRDAVATDACSLQRLTALQMQLEERRRVQKEAQRLEADGGQYLYLYARKEYEVDWKDRYEGLIQAGYGVTPNEPEPKAETPEQMLEISQERERQLRDCDALLLVATKDGYKLDDDMLSVGRQARSLARDRTKNCCPVPFWTNPEVQLRQRCVLPRLGG